MANRAAHYLPKEAIMTDLNINIEFSLFTDLINKLWDGVNTDKAKKAIRFAFQQGLIDGKLWIDQHATMRIAAVLNRNDKVCFPLEARGKCCEDASYYDALCLFDSRLNHGLSDIHRSTKRYGRWDYSEKADELCYRIDRDFKGLSVSPKEDDADYQDAIAKAYQGEHACGSVSLPTPQRLTYKSVQYNKDEQGMSYHRSLFSTIYSHGLYCAELKNTQILIRDLLPTYSKRNEPLNFDNGDEILAIALKNPFVALIHQLHPFSFSSSEKYEAYHQHKTGQCVETPEQAKKRIDDLIASILAIDTVKQDRIVDEIVDQASSRIGYFTLSDNVVACL